MTLQRKIKTSSSQSFLLRDHQNIYFPAFLCSFLWIRKKMEIFSGKKKNPCLLFSYIRQFLQNMIVNECAIFQHHELICHVNSPCCFAQLYEEMFISTWYCFAVTDHCNVNYWENTVKLFWGLFPNVPLKGNAHWVIFWGSCHCWCLISFPYASLHGNCWKSRVTPAASGTNAPVLLCTVPPAYIKAVEGQGTLWHFQMQKWVFIIPLTCIFCFIHIYSLED